MSETKDRSGIFSFLKDFLENTYRDYLAKFSLPGALDNYTDRQILDHLKNSGELKKIKEVALHRLDSLK